MNSSDKGSPNSSLFSLKSEFSSFDFYPEATTEKRVSCCVRQNVTYSSSFLSFPERRKEKNAPRLKVVSHPLNAACCPLLLPSPFYDLFSLSLSRDTEGDRIKWTEEGKRKKARRRYTPGMIQECEMQRPYSLMSISINAIGDLLNFWRAHDFGKSL